MRKLQLGSTGVEVSALCLGVMYNMTRYGRAASDLVLDRFVEVGGDFIDTANIYAHWIKGFSGGESETHLGEWMRQRGNRADLFIATKVGFGYGDVPRGLTARLIEEECEKSLRRMQIETIDLYYGHVDDRDTPLEETMEAFDRLVQAGKVRYIGASNYLAWRLEQAQCISQTRGWSAFCCVQQRYSYLRPMPGKYFTPQIAVNDDLLDYCRASGTTLLAYSVLLGGAFAHDDRPIPEQYVGPDTDARLRVLRAVAEETGATVNQVILAWMMQSDPVVLPLISAGSEAQIAENLGALDVRLSDDQMERLTNATA
jgi:aryl-alcohol dehydrogenase-like predicted oxidoreductase